MPKQEFVDQVMAQSNIADCYDKIELIESMFMQVSTDLRESKISLEIDLNSFKDFVADSTVNHYAKENLVGMAKMLKNRWRNTAVKGALTKVMQATSVMQDTFNLN